jgi:hypothetical protein
MVSRLPVDVAPSRATNLLRLGFALAVLIGIPLAHAQSLTIAPSSNPSVTFGGTLQFTATASGFTIAGLKWEVASVQGGSASTGTITTGLTGGLYTAPTSIPAQNPQSILAVATDTNGNKYTASAYVTIAQPPPAITAVTPSPLAAGNINVTVTGTGLQTGAEVFFSYGNYTGIAMSTTGMTIGSISATGYLGAASSASFCVRNPGTGCSNSIVVAVGGNAPATYTLTVVNGTTANGTGSGSYAAGTVVTITANAAPSGEQFQSWTGAAVANPNSASTTLTMPVANTTVTAGYIATPAGLSITSVSPNPLPTGTVTVTITGTGFSSSSTIWDDGVQYATQQFAGTLQTSVYTPPGTASATFTVHNSGSVSNAVTVPVSGPATTYTLTVVNGTTANGMSSGSYAAGTVVTITANAAPSGQQFQSWTGAAVANPNSATTTLTMPAANTTVTAGYTAVAPATYTLTVVNGTTANGTSSGSYAAGTVVTITANAAPSGQQFQSWTGTTVANATASTTTLTMAAANTTVTAGYIATPAGLSITSVSPNPLPTGTVTITITGTGFSSSSTIWDGGVQYAAQQPTPNTLTTSIYTSPGIASVTFAVHNSGSVSNAVTVPVSGPPTYTLTVVNGTGSGSFTAGTVVTISANPPPAGQSFTGWTGASVSNTNAPTTSITMPAANTTVTANFATGPTYALTVVGGQGSGNYVAGAVVTITANNPPAGQLFLGWTGATVANANSPATTLIMPASAVTVTASFSQPTYTLTVVNGTNSGNYPAGTVVPISPTAPPAGQYFQHWTGPGVANTSRPSTTVTMPAASTTITAIFFTPLPIPQPVTTHPRLWVTTADLPRLRSWAANSNPMYGGMAGVLGGAIGNYYACFPGATLSAKIPHPPIPIPTWGTHKATKESSPKITP